MARRLVEVGVSLVQVNLGNNETWDTHGNAFPHLRDNLLPPTDQAVSALLDDLDGCGLLESTLVVMAGEFGRTPRISTLPASYKLPGRDHWGRVQTVFLAGGGVIGGRVIGSSDRIGGNPALGPADAGRPGGDDLSLAGHPGAGNLARRPGPSPSGLSGYADRRADLSLTALNNEMARRISGSHLRVRVVGEASLRSCSINGCAAKSVRRQSP